ncbi:MAG: GDSL-type esterase/lipase family protein [Pseudomonadota bacterium]
MKQSLRISFGVLVLLAVGEAFARFGLGLGDPPLIVIDSKIEYLFAPSRTYRRFGNTISYNSKSMRASEVPPVKKDGDRRVLVLGDSVVNGGALTDQRNIASEILAQRLGPHFWVGNISAGSWGPANLLAYVERNGWFEADAAIIVLSTHDVLDLPEFRSSYGPEFPETTPTSALVEGLTRYIPHYIPQLGSYLRSKPSPPSIVYSQHEQVALGKDALRKLISSATTNVMRVFVVLHPTRTELASSRSAERATLQSIVASANVPTFDMLGARAWGEKLYRDDIHPNEQGQALYARVFECLLQAGTQTSNCDSIDATSPN